MFKNNVFTIITAGYWSESLLKLWVTLLIIWSELMQPISWCVYCHSSCEFVVVFSVFTVVECASFCTNQSLLLHFFLSFFFCTSLSWVDQSSVVIKPSQGTGWWWSALADFFCCCSEAIFCFGSELLCRWYKQLVIWMLIFKVDCAGSGGLLLFASQDATIGTTIRRMYFLSC